MYIRLLILTVFIVPALALSSPLRAQDPTATSPTEETADEATQTNEEKENIFSTASDTQIKEAQKFYKHCKNNATMSKKKDCKCSATLYLEKRIELGESATVNDIMAESINSCLKDERRTTIDDDSPADLSEVTDKQLEEAETVFNECKGNMEFSKYYDCECYAAEFLNKRLEEGPIARKEIILNTLRNKCRNIVDSTGEAYSRCMKDIRDTPIRDIESKDYCECYARRWAKIFKSYQGVIDSISKSKMRQGAYAYCEYEHKY